MKEFRVLVVIPARGGSKGIPRKNLRPVAGKPLIYYSINTALKLEQKVQVVVSTDDDEIALFAERFGAEVILRPAKLADDVTTLDDVVVFVVKQAEEKWKTQYDYVVTVQPTSPLITAAEINVAIAALEGDSIDTVLSVVDDRHLSWTLVDDRPVPIYKSRVNRQELPPSYKETGAIIACTREQIKLGTRIGSNIQLLEIPHDRSIDIDTFADMAVCESLLKRMRIVFTVIGYDKVGLGHAYRALMLAHELVNYDIHFICEKSSHLAIKQIQGQHYTVHICEDDYLAETCVSLNPELVINDILDTDDNYIKKLKQAGITVVNFEDMGTGCARADLVVNALYPHQLASDHVLVGSKYFCLRDEFLYLPERNDKKGINRILLTFGGVDEGDLTVRCLALVDSYCFERDIAIDIVTGPGYSHLCELKTYIDSSEGSHITIAQSTSRISDYMCNADLAITSGGRTVLELTALQVPTIVICQNMRETTHTFASSDNGVLNLGYREDINDAEIMSAIIDVIENNETFEMMKEKAREQDFRAGKKRVINRITELLHDKV